MTDRSASMLRCSVLAWSVVSLAAVLTGCDNAGADRVLAIDTSGTLLGFVYFDGNATREFDAGDNRMRGVRVAILKAGTQDTVDARVSGDSGEFVFRDIAVGEYRVAVDTTTVGDTAIVARIDTSEVLVGPGDSVGVAVAVSFPLLAIAELRTRSLGTRAFVDGVALNARNTFGDSTIHIADTSGSFRSIRAGPGGGVFPGDSVRLRGTLATRNGQRVLDMDRRDAIVLAIAELPVQDTLNTATAAAANGGALDAALIRLDTATVTDTSTASGDFVVEVDDGSGILEVVLDKDAVFSPGPFLIPGVHVTVSGVLVPASAGRWQLKPRDDNDLDINVPVISIAQARAAASGTLVFIDGVALNNRSDFLDNTAYIKDTSASIRATRVRQTPTFAFRDSVRFVGRMSSRDGQPVIDDVVPFVLGPSLGTLLPTILVAQNAVTANGGVLDGALVQVTNLAVNDTVTSGFDFFITVDDGTYPPGMSVVIDQYAARQFVPTLYGPGGPLVPLDVTGVLVPDGSGSWFLRPRTQLDIK